MSLAQRALPKPDPYLLMLIGTVAIAFLLPAKGVGRTVADWATYVAVFLLFFLYGARLSLGTLWLGLSNWKLQLLVFLTTYVMFPLLGLAVVRVLSGSLAPGIAAGILFLCMLPSTVQSSVALTSIARGDVGAALCSASLSNLIGVVLTPLFVTLALPASLLLTGRHDGFLVDALEKLTIQIVLPFAAGQLCRPILNGWLNRHKLITLTVDRGSILLVVYAAFSAGVVSGIWSQQSPLQLLLILVLDGAILFAAIFATTVQARFLALAREEEIVLVFCGSKKSMASGIPMATALFSTSTVSMIVLPLMIFHQLQLFVCAIMARRYASREAPVSASAPAPS